MLEYLVSSKVRLKLLRLLWGEAASGSVRELAARAGASYASTHNELCAMEKHGLAVSRGDGKAVVYEANPAFRGAQWLRGILDDEPTGSEGRSQPHPSTGLVLASLKALGAPLADSANVAPLPLLPPVETFARALLLARESATVLRVLPWLLATKVDQLDLVALKRRAAELRQTRALGFILDVTGALSRKSRLHAEADSLFDARVKHDEDFFRHTSGSFSQALARRNTPPLARKWHFVLNMPMESFRSFYAKYREAA